MKKYNKYFRNKTILITGGGGFIGKNLQKYFIDNEINYISVNSNDYDLTNQIDVGKLFSDYTFDIIVHLAGFAGGIEFIKKNMAQVYFKNLMLNTLLLKHAVESNTSTIIALNSVNAYPSGLNAPFRENSIYDGLPEKNISSYGMAKRMMLFQSQLYSDLDYVKIINLIADNIYGPHDIFEYSRARVIPANISKFIEAKINNKKVSVWGTGKARRDFIYVDDIIAAIIFSIVNIGESTCLNIGTGTNITIKSLVEKIAYYTQYSHKICWDQSKPEGELIRYLNVEKMIDYGFHTQNSIDDGLTKTIEWYQNHIK